MSDSQSNLDQLIGLAQDGEQAALIQIITGWESTLRRMIRVQQRMAHRRFFDSADLYQSAIREVLQSIHEGKVEYRSEGELFGFMKSVIENKLISKVRALHAKKRDIRLTVNDQMVFSYLESDELTPDEKVANQEQFDRVFCHFTESEREIAQMRLRGYRWENIMKELNNSHVDAARRKFRRACDRLAELPFDGLTLEE